MTSLFNIMLKYTNPFIIISALFLLMTFSKVTFYNKWINNIAASCFAVYLMHFMIFPTFMRHWIQNIAALNNGIPEFAKITCLLFVFYAVAIIIDKFRLTIWNKFLSPFFKS